MYSLFPLHSLLIDQALDVKPTQPLNPFPLCRFRFYNDFHYYHVFSNIPLDDYLQSTLKLKRPDVLVLGCGEVRSCLYSLWRNTESLLSGQFTGVQFVLNDCNAAVLARNLVFLYLCTKAPPPGDLPALRKWMAALWGIWFCHELLPDHKRLLDSTLTQLLKFSKSSKMWSSPANPLSPFVRFTNAFTLRSLQDFWNMWLSGDIGFSSVSAFLKSRRNYLQNHGNTNIDEYFKSYSENIVVIFTGIARFSDFALDPDRMKAQFHSYISSGSAFAEDVLGMPVEGETFVNPTFVEMPGVYSVYCSLVPYVSFVYSLPLTREAISKVGVSHSAISSLPLCVPDELFKEFPILASGVQQLSLWCSTLNFLAERSLPVLFNFHCSDAIAFCQELLVTPELFPGIPCRFDAVYTSSLMDLLATPNVVLSAIHLLRDDASFLFTISLTYLQLTNSMGEFLALCFGVESSSFPVLFGMRCIGQDGMYSSEAKIQPTTFDLTMISETKKSKNVLVWEKLRHLTPLHIDQLEKTSSVTNALSQSVCAAITSYAKDPENLSTTRHMTTETALKALLTFMLQLDEQSRPQSASFWDGLCALLREKDSLPTIFHEHLQTQALLHQIHLHLTVSGLNCPLCNHLDPGYLIRFFSVSVPDLLTEQNVHTPQFVVFVHKCTSDEFLRAVMKSPHLPWTFIVSLPDVHAIDSVVGSRGGSEKFAKLQFFFPESYASEGYLFTVIRFDHAGVIGKSVNMPSKAFSGKLADHFDLTETTPFYFQKPQVSSASPNTNLGKIQQHCGDSNSFSTVILLNDSVLSARENNPLDTKFASANQIQIMCAHFKATLSYPYPVDYLNLSIRLSRKTKTIEVTVPRRPYCLYEEKPVYVASPNSLLSFPSMILTPDSYQGFGGMQFTCMQREMLKCREKGLPTLVSVKDVINNLFQFCATNAFFHVAVGDLEVHALILCNRCLFDIQNQSPAVVVYFCFPELPTLTRLVPKWLKIAKADPDVPVKRLSLGRLEDSYLFRDILNCFAKRTCFLGSKHKVTGPAADLVKHRIIQYFTCCVLYPLYGSADDLVLELRQLLHTKIEATKAECMRSTATLQETMQKCIMCGSTSAKLKKCGGCERVKYCSKECQTLHWGQHKVVCKIRKEIAEKYNLK